MAADEATDMTQQEDKGVIGVIAGEGMLPVAVVRNLKMAGHRVVCAGLHGQSREDLLRPLCDHFSRVGLIRINQWIRVLRRHGATRAIMVGRVAKERLYAPFHLLRYIPDWRFFRIYFGRLRHDKRSANLLRAVADELASGGVMLIDARNHIPELLADVGVMTRRRPTAEIMADTEFAWPLLQRINELLIGQCVSCLNREIIAVEAVEGTDRMIERTHTLCPRGGWILCKASNPNQDVRFDLPTVGPATIENLKRGGAAALILQAGKTIMLEKPALLKLADDLGIVVIGRE